MAAPKVGDLVELTSGGMNMTVTEVKPDGTVKCEWFDIKGKRDQSTFPPDALRKARRKVKEKSGENAIHKPQYVIAYFCQAEAPERLTIWLETRAAEASKTRRKSVSLNEIAVETLLEVMEAEQKNGPESFPGAIAQEDLA